MSLIDDLKNLGIKEGDILYITADILNVGYYNKNKKNTMSDWVDILSTVVGTEGCFITSSYTKTFYRWRKSKDIIFNRFSKTDNGSLSNALINLPQAVRSTHPTHSYIGIGKNVSKYLSNHNVHSSSYKVLENIMNDGGKFLMLGTIDQRNAPQALHLVQEVLGYTKYSPYKWIFQTYYIDENGEKRLYTKTEFGGCSSGCYKLFGPLLIKNAVEINYVGIAKSALMDSQKSYQVIKKILIENKKYALCDNSLCTQCYGNFFYNGWKIFPFFIRKIISGAYSSR